MKKELTVQDHLLQRLMLESAGNLATAHVTPKEASLLEDVDFVIENVFTGVRIVRTGFKKTMQFMFDKGLVNGDNPAYADWYVSPLNER